MCTVIVTNHRWCHNVLKTWLHLVSNFFVLTTFWCHLFLLNRHTNTWNLPFVKYTQFYCIMYIFLQPENIWTNKLSHPLGCCCLRFMSLQGLIFFSLNWQKAMLCLSQFACVFFIEGKFLSRENLFCPQGFPFGLRFFQMCIILQMGHLTVFTFVFQQTICLYLLHGYQQNWNRKEKVGVQEWHVKWQLKVLKIEFRTPWNTTLLQCYLSF